MLAKILSSAVVGLNAVPIDVEVNIVASGLPKFIIVGLPDKAVSESAERVRAAVKNSGADFPARRITVSLAPADLPKEGLSYDLPIAGGMLIASGQMETTIDDAMFMGELSLDGNLRHTNGVLPQVLLAKEQKLKRFFLPAVNAKEAALIEDIDIYPVENLTQLFLHLTNQATTNTETSEAVRKRVQEARDRQLQRFAHTTIKTNTEMSSKDVKLYCVLDDASVTLLKMAVEKLELSARSYYRILKLARTIADLAHSENIQSMHIAESLNIDH